MPAWIISRALRVRTELPSACQLEVSIVFPSGPASVWGCWQRRQTTRRATRLAIEYFRRTLVVTKVPKQESFCFCIIGSTPRHIKLRCRRIQFSVCPDGSSVSVCQAPAHRQSPYLHHPRARKPGHKQPAPYQTGG